VTDDDPAPPLSGPAQYALWLDLVRGRVTEEQAAARHDLDVAAVRRIRQVAEQAALSALSSTTTDTTAQVSAAGSPAGDAGGRVVDLLADDPVFFDVPDERRHDLARHATLAFLGRATPVADGLADGPLVVAAGTMLAVDRQDRPVDLIGAGVFRAPRAGRRLRSVTDARVVALPAAAADDAVATTRARLAASRPFSGERTAVGRWDTTRLTTGVLADLLPPDGSGPPPAAAPAPVAAADTPLLDALHLMLVSGARVVRVADGDRVVGAVADADLPLPVEAGLPSLLDVLAGAETVETLMGVSSAARMLSRSVLEAGADVTDVGRLLAAVGDQVVRRLLTIAGAELGPAPADFAWLVFGSHARRELTPGSDQDTGLVYEAGLDDDGHRWFDGLGTWMTAALETCGYPRCGGGVMASEPAWRHDLDGWARAVTRWTDPGDSSALVGADIGFDVRAVFGTGGLAAADVGDRLTGMIIDTTRHELTAARLARGAVSRRPPSGLWGRVGRNPLGPALGAHPRRFDLKRHGIQPIVDIARMHTLARGGRQLATIERLAASAVDGSMSVGLAATLVEGLRLLTWTRLATQLDDAGDGQADRVEWSALPRPARRQFSETFGAIRAAQDALRTRYRLAPGS
jgi:CBS domain-containing protein